MTEPCCSLRISDPIALIEPYPQTWAWDLHEVVFDCGVLPRSFSDQEFLIDIEMHDYKHSVLLILDSNYGFQGC